MAETKDRGGTVWDAPNQQVVRADESPPWAEGDGGSTGPEIEPPAADVSTMTKAQLLEEADRRGVEADDSMTKAQIAEALEEA